MRILGFDPGPTTTAWTPIEVEGQRVRRWLDHGVVRHPVEIADQLHRQLPGTLIAVETPSGYVFEHARGRALLDTARVAGEIFGIATSLGWRVERLSAQEWRKAVVGRANASDGHVRGALAVLIRNMPRTNNHQRDAAGCALAVAMKLGNVRKVA